MSNLILIGPQNVGKTSTALWISSTLQIPHRSLDDRYQPWFRDNQPAYKEALALSRDNPNRERLFKLAEAVSVQECLRSVDGAAIDFGAGHSVYNDATQFEMVRSAVEGHRVVLLLPSINVELSRAYLHERCHHDFGACQLVNWCLDNPSNRRLGQVVVYTSGKSPIEVAEEVMERVPDWCASVRRTAR